MPNTILLANIHGGPVPCQLGDRQIECTQAYQMREPLGSAPNPLHRMNPQTPRIMKSHAATVHLVHNDPVLCDGLAGLLRDAGLRAEVYPSLEAFVCAAAGDPRGCLVLDIDFPGLDQRCSQSKLLATTAAMPIILLMRKASLPSCSRAIKSIAIDFLIEPFERHSILESVDLACAENSRRLESANELASLLKCYESLTIREKQVLELVCEGLMNKQAAAILDLSVITVKVHRATMMRKMRCRRLVDLVRAADALGVGSPRSPFGTRRRQSFDSNLSSSCQPTYADQHQVSYLSS